MRFVLDGTCFEGEIRGIARVSLRLYEAVREIIPDVQISWMHQRELACDCPDYVRNVRFGSRLDWRSWRRFVMPAYALASGADVFHFPVGHRVIRIPGRCLVMATLHDVCQLEVPGYFPRDYDRHRYLRKTQRDIDRTELLTTVSDYSKQQIMKWFQVRREPVVIYPGCDHLLRCERDSSGSMDSAHPDGYFLYVGGYDVRKRVGPLVRAFLELRREKRISSRLVLAGPKCDLGPKFNDSLEEGRRSGAIQELGHVPDQHLADLYRGATAFVFPSVSEGFGLPPLEAMALGCPVISSNVSVMPEVCGDAALFADVGDTREFGRALEAVENGPALRQELIQKGRRQASRFTWRAAAEKLLTEIEEARAARCRHDRG